MEETELKKWADEFRCEYHETNWGVTSAILDKLIARLDEIEIAYRDLESKYENLSIWVEHCRKELKIP